ncbi:DUF4350 domain-containing protein [Hymenobacter sp. CRA2]|uniref:DUF4350 domain-containing protein n=1 Tax=Hymenobacter sp. CRA2 TaxID=1955620 RepID=UPI00098EDDFF|nr:DUF4350 domain-containing protein [Hymenobacter sp. CRA2]OON69747.1 hypothetical protein B0919_07415 [Hymenobacter sp. CRA2]
MLRSIRWPLAVLGGLLLLWALVGYYSPKPLDWTPTYRSDQKKPLGTYALYHLLRRPGSSLRTVRESPFVALSDSANPPAAYVLVQNEFKPGGADARALYRYLRTGGTVWLAANSFELRGRLDSLWYLPERTELPSQLVSIVPDSGHIRLTDPRLTSTETPAVLPNRVLGTSFDHDSAGALVFDGPDSLSHRRDATVLARTTGNRPVLVHLPVERGHLYLCTVPALFSNYGLLYRRNADFAAGALAYLPAGTIYWDEFYKQGRAGSTSLLRVVDESPALSWAWNGLLIGGVLFAVLGARRRQRPVPTLQPLPNTTLQFVRTIAGLYRQGRNHQPLAALRIRLFFDYLRTRFQEPLPLGIDAEYPARLSRRTGVPAAEVSSLLARLHGYLDAGHVSETELHQLHRLLADFRRRAES